MSNIQQQTIRRNTNTFIGRDFLPLLSPHQQVMQTQKLIDETMIISYTRDYGDLFFRKLRESYSGIPMHTKFRKKRINYFSEDYVGRTTYSLTYSIREGSGIEDLLKIISPFTKSLITLKRGPLEDQTVTIHDQELRKRENISSIQQIVNELNSFVPECDFVIDMGTVEDYINT